jgi:hypothetical protein
MRKGCWEESVHYLAQNKSAEDIHNVQTKLIQVDRIKSHLIINVDLQFDIAQVVQHFFPAELEQTKSRNVVIVVD